MTVMHFDYSDVRPQAPTPPSKACAYDERVRQARHCADELVDAEVLALADAMFETGALADGDLILAEDQVDAEILAVGSLAAQQRQLADLCRADIAAHHVAVAGLANEPSDTFLAFRPGDDPARSPLAPNAPNVPS